MRAELRGLYSTDVDDLAGWAPASDVFAVPVRLLVGPAGGPGEETFDLVVCSPGWLAEQVADVPVLDARHHLVVRDFDWPQIRAYLVRRVEACDGDRWQDVAGRLARLGQWEFEDYRELEDYRDVDGRA